MRFRTKILVCNMIVVSFIFVLCGTLLIYKNYTMAIGQEVKSESDKNQMLKATLETKVINLLLKDKYTGVESLQGIELFDKYNIGSDFCVLDEKLSTLSGTVPSEKALTRATDKLEEGSFYYIYEEDHATLILTASAFYIQKEKVYLVNYKDISYLYKDIDEQIRDFKVMFVIVLSLCGVVMYFIAYALTKSISQLHKAANEMSAGNFEIRSGVKTKDEIGDLNQAFNLMADSIQCHMDKLEEEGRKKEEFVANFTHEIKTPLTSIIGYSDLIRMNAVSDETRILGANYIYSEGMRLEKLSMKLFDLLLLGQEELSLKQIWVEALIQEVEFIVRPSLERDGISFVCEPMEACIMGDYEMLKTVFINLIDNARKASDPGKTVYFSAKREQDNICFVIEDNGVGIPEEELGKITEAFYMVDKSRSRQQGGAGLGLPLVQKIIGLHTGEMEIRSKAGEGTKIVVMIKESTETEGA